MAQWCKNCSSSSEFHLIDDTHVGGFGYSRIECNSCGTNYWSCTKCGKGYKGSNNDHRLISQHMNQNHDVPELTVIDNASDDDDEEYDDECKEKEDKVNNKIMQVFEVDSNNYHDNFEDSFDQVQLNIHGYDIQSFGNDISNTYFKQDFHMYHDHAELFGGIKGICWRS